MKLQLTAVAHCDPAGRSSPQIQDSAPILVTPLRDRKGRVQENDIDKPRERIEQIRHRGVIGQLTTGPRERLDDRKRIAGLEQRITDGYAKLRGLDIGITRQRTVMVEAEQGVNGHTRMEARQRMIIDHTHPKIGAIDQTLGIDVDRRTNRILETHSVDRDIVDRYRLKEPPGNTPDDVFDRWVGVVAKAEQYDQTWQGREPERRSVEWRAQDQQYENLAGARRGVERALEPYRPQITRPGPDLGRSL